jgi:DNA processing protein
MSIAVGVSPRERAALWDRMRPGRDIDEAEVTARVVWSVLCEPGDGIAGALVRDLGAAAALELVLHRAPFGTPQQLGRFAAVVSQRVTEAYEERRLEPIAGVRAGFQRWHPRMLGSTIETVLAMAAASQATLLLPEDPEWSSGLGDLREHAPLLLWCLGDPAMLEDFEHSVAIVGTRAASGYGPHVATELAAGLAERDWTVVSGGAYGIDAAAHRAALAAQGRTVAVMAGGLNAFYPTGNSELIARVAREGAVVAETAFGVAPTPFRFLARNRLIAAMTSASVLIEAGQRSGAVNTANHARDLVRKVGAVPGPVTSPSSAGCHMVLRDAERDATLITSVDDIVQLVRGEPEALEPLADPGDPRYGRVLKTLNGRTGRSVAAVASGSGLSAEDAASLLGVLLLDGAVRKTEKGWVSVPKKG